MTLLSKIQEEEFQDQGFLIFPKLFDNEEIQLLKQIAVDDRELEKQSVGRKTQMDKRFVWHYGINQAMESMGCSQDAIN